MNEEQIVGALQLSRFLKDVAVIAKTFWLIPVFVAADGKRVF